MNERRSTMVDISDGKENEKRLAPKCINCDWRVGYYCRLKKRETDEDDKCPQFVSYWRKAMKRKEL